MIYVRLLGTVLVLVALAGPAKFGRGEDGNFQVERLTAGVRATWGGKPVLEYRSADAAYKPYVSSLYTPSGVQVLRDSPPDHQHHHGLMFALGVNEVNFWHESPGIDELTVIGRQRGGEVQCRVASEKQTPQKLIIGQTLDWLAGDKLPLVRERRELVVRCEDGDDKILWLNWTSQLSPAGDSRPIVVKGERYFGLGMRFVQSMDKGGRFLFANDRDAEPAGKNENLICASWCAYVAKVNERPVTVAIFSNPANRRDPAPGQAGCRVPAARWFTMVEPFAYLAATLGLDQQPLELPWGETLKLSYGIVLADGELRTPQLQSLYDTWLQHE
jgi:hypothetical protein